MEFQKTGNVVLSTTEAEYMALFEAAQQTIWLRRFLDSFGYTQEEPTLVMGDNHGSMSLVKNPIDHQHTKHINIKYHFIREKAKEIEVTYVSSGEQTTDIFTKLLLHPTLLHK